MKCYIFHKDSELLRITKMKTEKLISGMWYQNAGEIITGICNLYIFGETLPITSNTGKS